MRTVIANCFSLIVTVSLGMMLVSGCGGKVNFLGKGAFQPLKIEEIDPADVNSGGTDNSNGTDNIDPGTKPGDYQNIPVDPATGQHPMFSGILGVPIAASSMSAVSSDLSGLTAVTDPDGDGIPTDQELNAEFSNPDVADCPRITTRIDTPVTMELRVDENNVTQNHSEMITDTDVKNTINNSMENKQYNQLNKKTTPYPVKNSLSWSDKNAGSMGLTTSLSLDTSVSAPSVNVNNTTKMDMSTNMSWDQEQTRATNSEKTVFENVNYIDNLNRNGSEYKNDTVERISRNFRQSAVSKSDFVIGPNAGYVRASLFLVNESRNIPVRVSNVICTLSFRTPSGNCLPVKTFRLRYDDYSEFDEEVYGGQELGPYAINIPDLNTNEVKKALANGYMPQIHVVSYDMHRVENSNYNPGVDNLKIVEETAKSRTAVIKIIGAGTREMYRVPAFEVDEDGIISPGISLKRALFNIYRDRIGGGEQWGTDSEGKELTVNDLGLKWKPGFENTSNPDQYRYTNNETGNSWNSFGTYVKSYSVTERVAITDEAGNVIGSKLDPRVKRIETIERIGNLKKYNPFSPEDNPSYNEKEPLTMDQFCKMKYWIILHNGRYFNGDINDPIWAGERYEIVLFDAKDFNERFKEVAYAPLMNSTGENTSSESSSSDYVDYSQVQNDYDFKINTMWNPDIQNSTEFARSKFLGRVVRGDVIRLDIELDEFRSLFNIDKPGQEFGPLASMSGLDGKIWHKFNYTFEDGESLITGMPGSFDYEIWGGCNNIILRINDADNTRYYTASFWQPGITEDEARAQNLLRVAKIMPKDLKENYGYYVISRVTNDSNGEPIGPISGGAFNMRVRSHGVAYNVPVNRLGTLTANGSAISQATTSVVTVENPTLSEYPGSFITTSVGMENSMTVMINQSNKAEYYVIDVTGPYNYGHGNGEAEGYTPPVKRFIGHAGQNVLTVSKHDSGTIGHMAELTDDEKNWAVPGLYRVAVFAVNRNCLTAEGEPNPGIIVAAAGDPQTVMVDYNRYEEQKQYIPKLQYEEFNPKDVDLEVNFNDGSGWFRLKIAGNDNYDADRFVNCTYSTFFQQNRGRVTVYFTAPTGPGGVQNQQYNVFRGGAEMVDVYLRTKAANEYRDKLWPLSSVDEAYDAGDPEEYRCININTPVNNPANPANDLPGYDPLLYWVGNDNTDATKIEDYDVNNQGPHLFTSPTSMKTRVSQGDFGVVAPRGKSDFFFAPWKKLTYKIKASLVEKDLAQVISEVSHVDNPRCRPIGGYQSVFVNWLESQYAESIKVDWKQLSTSQTGSSTYIPVTPAYYKIINLVPNERYEITLTAKNSISESAPVTYVIKTLPEATRYTMTNPLKYSSCYYRFKEPVVPLTTDTGNLLVNGENFAYGQALNAGSYDIWDTNNTDVPLVTGKYIRIIEGGRNMNYLTPVAKSLTGAITSPPGNQLWIDPVLGTFLLPRPVYWSRCESLAGISTTADLKVDGDFTPTLVPANAYLSSGGMYNSNYWLKPGPVWDTAVSIIKPFGDNYVTFMDKGTVSMWVKPYFSLQAAADLRLYISDSTYIKFINDTVEIYSNGNNLHEHTTTVVLGNNVWNHVYVIWDAGGALETSKTIKVYVNGNLVLSSIAPIVPAVGSKKLQLQMRATVNIGLCNLGIDNIKIWNHVVTDGATAANWERNAGSGNEYGIHAVYGPTNGYKPVLTSPNGVGFYCIPR